jgi:hypothetical protein
MSDDDNDSVKTPTQSELNTFKVLANMDFTNLQKAPPEFHSKSKPASVIDVPDDQKSEVASVHSLHHVQGPRTPELPSSRRSSVVSEVYIPERQEKAGGPTVATPYELPETLLKAQKDIDADVAIEKEALLYEIELMEKQGLIQLHRKLTMQHSLDEIQYQYDRANMIVSTQQTVEWAKTGIKMGSSVLEAVLKRFGVSLVDGFSNNLCKDMGRFNKPLTKLYRKYWRRGTSSPEMELAMIVFGALAMTVMANKGIFGGSAKQTAAPPVVTPQVPSFSTVAPVAAASDSILKAPNTTVPTAKTIPDWARAALNGPLGAPVPQQPASRATNEFPEVAPERPMPMMPVPARAIEQAAEPVKETTKEPVEEEIPIKRLTLTNTQSPRSIRKRREAPVELNLDI